jgi:pyruvate formate lyase activating enzyme
MGRWLTVEQVLAEVMKDALCFEHSNGGLTLSGGEPMAQADFAAALLRTYKRDEKGLHTVMETSGAAEWSSFQMLAEDVDLFLYDIKHMDPIAHQRLTGLDNRLILANASALAQMGRALVIRLPLIPDMNDSEANLVATAEFVLTLPGVQRIDILPYHRLGEPKYRRLGLPYALAGVPSIEAERLESARAILRQSGLEVRIGG